MSTRSTSTLPPLARSDQEDRRKTIRRLGFVNTIREQHAAAIIAHGLFTEHTELWSGVAMPIARQADEDDGLREKLKAICDRTDNTDGQVDVAEVVAHIQINALDAGFLVGLAVGMQLGPDAFGGAR